MNFWPDEHGLGRVHVLGRERPGDRVTRAGDRLDRREGGGRRARSGGRHRRELAEVERLGERHPHVGVAGLVAVVVVVPLLAHQGGRLGGEQVLRPRGA